MLCAWDGKLPANLLFTQIIITFLSFSIRYSYARTLCCCCLIVMSLSVYTYRYIGYEFYRFILPNYYLSSFVCLIHCRRPSMCIFYIWLWDIFLNEYMFCVEYIAQQRDRYIYTIVQTRNGTERDGGQKEPMNNQNNNNKSITMRTCDVRYVERKSWICIIRISCVRKLAAFFCCWLWKYFTVYLYIDSRPAARAKCLIWLVCWLYVISHKKTKRPTSWRKRWSSWNRKYRLN